jgi:serine/threonine protein kinase
MSITLTMTMSSEAEEHRLNGASTSEDTVSSPEEEVNEDEDMPASESFEEIPDSETWAITRRDVPLTNAAAIGAMDHAYTVLNDRLAGKGENIDVKIFNKTLPRFMNSEIELGKRIAWGAFAEIYLIRKWNEAKSVKACSPELLNTSSIIMQQTSPEDLVIKVLRPTLLMNPDLYATGAADILTEATLLATLDHPHIVKIWGRSVSSVEGFASGKRDAFFLILERLECNLLDKLAFWKEKANEHRIIKEGIREGRQYRARSILERIGSMMQLADAMVYLHERNIIHRDLKLSNVTLDRKGKIKLIDFGLAKILPPHSSEKDTFKMTSNTGSIRYMAPEIARGEQYNLKADVFSFAILLYEVLNLDKVWNGLSADDIRSKVVIRKQRPLPSMFWPSGMRDLLKSTWSDNPAARLSMKHVRVVLEKQAKLLQTEVEALEGADGEPETPAI